jgi:hypothetical protein
MEISECAGFRKNDDSDAEGESFFPVSKELIAEMLLPLSLLLKKACYVHLNSRCAAALTPRYLVRPKNLRHSFFAIS